jgi:hypothetical protein
MNGGQAEGSPQDTIACPNCGKFAGRLHAVATVADKPDDYKLTYRCMQCDHEWALVKPAHWMTRLGEDT